MKKFLVIISLFSLLFAPLSGFAQISPEDKEQIKQNAEDTKKQTQENISENLGIVTTPEQQKNAFKKIFAGLAVILDEAEEEIKGSKNLTDKQKQQMLAGLDKIEDDVEKCDTAIDAAKTQEELNTAYAQCVEEIKQTINEFLNTVYAVMLEALDEYLKITKTFLVTTRASVALLSSCQAVDPSDIQEITKLLDEGDALWNQLNAHYQVMKGVSYQRENVVKAADLTARLSAKLARIYGEYEDQYVVYTEQCGGNLPELQDIEDIEQQVEDTIQKVLP